MSNQSIIARLPLCQAIRPSHRKAAAKLAREMRQGFTVMRAKASNAYSGVHSPRARRMVIQSTLLARYGWQGRVPQAYTAPVFQSPWEDA